MADEPPGTGPGVPGEPTASAPAAEDQREAEDQRKLADQDDTVGERSAVLRFAFESAPWRSVISWVADQSDLALHVGGVPPGSFTYADDTGYTPDEAIERINLFLIPQGYAMVRQGRLLSVINLSDPRSVQQLEAMADLIAVDDLPQRGRHDVVRCLFPIGDASPSAVVQELRSISLMTDPVVLAQSRQLLITDTAAKLRVVARMLAGVAESRERGESIRRFEVRHQSVSDVLAAMRPHLGLQDDEMIGLGLSISVSRDGDSFVVTGSRQTLEMVESLLPLVDVPESERGATEGAVLRSYPVSGPNLTTVYEVLQTLLAGESIRLSIERDSNSVVAFAPPRIQETIALTVEELRAPGTEFDVVDLGGLDPYFAMSLLNELFRPIGADDEQAGDAAPKLDADPASGRLFVRGRRAQIEEVRSAVEKLRGPRQRSSAGDAGFRVLDIPEKEARSVLEMAERFWDGEADVVIFGDDPRPRRGRGSAATPARERTFHPPSGESQRGRRETIGREADEETLKAGRERQPPEGSEGSEDARPKRLTPATSPPAEPSPFVAKVSPKAGEPVIKTQITAQGILMQSDDGTALDRFEDHLRAIAELRRGGTVDQPMPVIFYLKYVRADDATRILADLLDGAVSLSEPSGGLVSGYWMGSGTPYLGSFVNRREETTTMTSGSATVVSDARLNRLIVQGTEADIGRIESYLKIIDKDQSLTRVETYGRSQVIPLRHTDAEQVAEVIRKAYPGRIAEESRPSDRGGQDARQRQDRGRGDDDGNRRGDQGQDGRPQMDPPKPTRSREPMLAVAVHPQSNSVVVTAPEPLLREVERLVESIDARSEQDFGVIAPENPEAVRAVIEGLLSNRPANSNSRSGGSSGSRDGRSGRDGRGSR